MFHRSTNAVAFLFPNTQTAEFPLAVYPTRPDAGLAAAGKSLAVPVPGVSGQYEHMPVRGDNGHQRDRDSLAKRADNAEWLPHICSDPSTNFPTADGLQAASGPAQSNVSAATRFCPYPDSHPGLVCPSISSSRNSNELAHSAAAVLQNGGSVELPRRPGPANCRRLSIGSNNSAGQKD